MCLSASSFAGVYGGLEVSGEVVLMADAERDLASYLLGVGTNVSWAWTHTDAGVVEQVVVRGRYAYVAGGKDGMVVVDLVGGGASTNGARAWFDTIGSCRDVAVMGTVAFAADSGDGVAVVDVNDADWSERGLTVALQRIATITWGSALGLEAVSNVLYVAAGDAGLRIYDVSDPVKPFFVGSRATVGSAREVEVRGGLAYVVCGASRLEILNVANPGLPVLLGSYTTAGSVADVDVRGGYAFLANTNGALEVLSVSNAASPLLVTNYLVAGGAFGVRVVGNLAYVRDAASGLVVVELAGFVPESPRLVRPVEGVTVLAGQEVVLSVEVEGSAPLAYQWFKDGMALVGGGRISGVDGPYLKLKTVVEADAGAYSVVVTNAYGGVVGSNAVVSLVPPGTPISEGVFKPGGFTSGVWMEGRFAYAAAGGQGLSFFDLLNPSYPVFMGNLDTSGNATAVEVFGEQAYVADGSAGVQIVNLANFPGLVLGGNVETPGTALGLNVVAGMVYVADGEGGLQVIDATEPTQPVLVGGWNSPGTAYAVRVVGGLAYVADGVAGVAIVNVTNPASPFLVGSYNTAGTAYRVEVVGERAFVADGTNGLVILDVSDPGEPTAVGHYATAGPAMGLVVVGTMALVAEGQTGLEVVDISELTNATRIGVIGAIGDARDVTLVGNTICVACGGEGVRILSLLGVVPSVPGIVSVPATQYVLPGQGVLLPVVASGLEPLKYQWSKDGRVLFESGTFKGVTSDTLRITNTAFSESGRYSLKVLNAWNLGVRASANVQVVPVGTPLYRTNYNDGTDLLDVQVTGQRAYVASRLGGLQVMDLRDVQKPVLVGSHPTLGFAQQVYVHGHLAYVAAWDAGLEIFDVADPTNLVRRGRCETPGLARGVHVVGGMAYVADQTNGLQVIDVRNPSQPFWLANAATLGSALSVQVSAGKAYVAASGAGLEIFDVSDPLWVVRLGRIDTPGVAENVELTGTSALVADYNQGLKIIDVSDPFEPRLVCEFAAPGDSFHVQVVSNLAFVAQGVAGLDAVAATNPTVALLTLVGQPQASVHAAAVSGKHAFLADRSRGFVVAELLGVPPGLPQLEESPESTEAIRGSNLVLSVAVSGTPPFTYKWYKDGVGLSAGGRVQGVSEPHLRVNTLTNLDAGAYVAVVSSPYGAVTSGVANVTVSAPGMPPVAPVINTQPLSQTVLQGGTVTFGALASGSGPLRYRWSLNGQPVTDGPHYSGATSNSLRVSNVTLPQEGVYQLKVWNDAGVATSAPVSLTIVLPPGAYFYDAFARPSGVDQLAPWQVKVGSWTIADGTLRGVTNGLSGHASIYVGSDWTDYSVEARASIPANGFGWFLGGRLNPLTGEYYEVFLYGNYDAVGPWRLHLTKHVQWGPSGWDGVNLAYQPDVEVPGAGTTNLHALKMTFQGNRILVHYDGSLKMDVRDDNFPAYGQPWPVFSSGGIIVGMYSTNDYVLRVEDVVVRQVPIATNLLVTMEENGATNLVLQGSIGEGTRAFAILGGPTNGILSNFDANAGTLTYTPATHYTGSDHFTFTVSDGTLVATGVAHITVTTSLAPVILSLSRVDPTNVVIAWSAFSNRTYRLLFTDDMDLGNWINEAAEVTARGSIAATTNAAGVATQRYYRVLLLP